MTQIDRNLATIEMVIETNEIIQNLNLKENQSSPMSPRFMRTNDISAFDITDSIYSSDIELKSIRF